MSNANNTVNAVDTVDTGIYVNEDVETQDIAETVEPTTETPKKTLTSDEKKAKRAAYAREYYKNNRQKRIDAAKRCRAKKLAAKQNEPKPIVVDATPAEIKSDNALPETAVA